MGSTARYIALLLALGLPLSAFAIPLLAASPAALDPPAAVLEAESRRIEVIDRAKDSVLAIFSADGKGGGSGVVISPDGYALTNFHVAQPCGTAMKCGMADGQVYDAVIVGVDPTGDVALIKLFANGQGEKPGGKKDGDKDARHRFPFTPLGDSDQVRAGDPALVMGNPFLLATDFQPTVTYGIVSGVHRYQFPAGTLLEYTDCIQTDASINPGNSGGPLFDAQGRLIGINGRGSFEKRGRVNVGVGYAVSINQIKNFLGYLHSGRIVDHATLGARVGFDENGRVVVIDILEDSDAYRRGLRYDDEIVSFGGRPIATPNGFKNVLGIYPKGWRVPLSFRREGQRHDVLVRLAGVHRQSELIEDTLGRSRKVPMPIPKPGDKPGQKEGRKPSDRAPKDEQHPVPMPGDKEMAGPPDNQPPMPAVVKEHFQARRGYANYYYNKQNRDRVWGAWVTLWDSAGSRPRAPGGDWKLSGPLQGGGTYLATLTDDSASLDLPAGKSHWKTGDQLTGSPPPPGSGGLLPALFCWRRLAVLGPEGFGDVYYLGTAPLDGRDRMVDVLVGIHAGAECRFFFDPDDGTLLALEMFPEEGVDPCEIRFLEYRPVDGHLLPGRMEVRVGDGVYGVFPVATAELKPKETTSR